MERPLSPPHGADSSTRDGHADEIPELLDFTRERQQVEEQQVTGEIIADGDAEAVRAGNTRSLPSGMYLRAMLRQYADSVGLDPSDAAAEFERTFEHPARQMPSDAPSSVVVEEPRASPTATMQTPYAPSSPIMQATVPRRTVPRVHAAAARRQRLAPVVVAVPMIVGALAVVLLLRDSNPGFVVEESSPVRSDAPAAPLPVGQPEQRAAVQDDQPSVQVEPPVTTEGPTVPVERPAVPTEPPPAPVEQVVPRPSGARQGSARRAPAPVRARTTARASAAAPRSTQAQAAPGRSSLVVQSEPDGARVTVNGVGWGVTPVTIPNLPPGPKRVRLTLDGYVSQERTVTVDSAGRATTVRATLESAQ